MTDLTLEIGGMTCGHCVAGVSRALKELPGVEVDTVTVGKAVVQFDAGAVKPAEIAKAITDEGYQVLTTR
jgi:copper chaperone